MSWRLLGTVTNVNFDEPSVVTASALATTPRSRGCGFKAGNWSVAGGHVLLSRGCPCKCALVCVLQGDASLWRKAR